ncbi:MAG: tetratricopeptide repeat protein [Planctomycetes bacterium]|nr:tetratricopeptide repeat protein [Planctomycetota bacterium]
MNLAAADLQTADRLAPRGQTKASLGYCLSRLDQTREAIHYYRQALDLGLTSAEVYGNLGFSYLKLHDLDKALDCLDRAIQLKPDFQAAHHNRARLFLLKAQAALPARKRLVGHGKRAAPSREFSASLEQGMAAAHRALELGPRPADLYFNAACLCALAGTTIDGRLLDAALQHLGDAVASGYNPQNLASVAAFAPLRDRQRFTALCASRPGAASPSETIRVVDPIGAVVP